MHTLYVFVIEDARDGIVDGVESGAVEALHGGRHQSQHTLRRPAHVLVAVPLDCAFHLVTLATTSAAESFAEGHSFNGSTSSASLAITGD